MKTLKLLALAMVASASFAVASPIYGPEFGAAETSVEIGVKTKDLQTQDFEFYYHDFGRVFVNSLSYVRYTVTNTGAVPLNFSSATISGIEFNAFHDCSGVLEVGQSCWFEIRYIPFFEGFDAGRFELIFQENVGLLVNLWGEGVRY